MRISQKALRELRLIAGPHMKPILDVELDSHHSVTPDWKKLHAQAMRDTPVGQMVVALSEYADMYRNRFESKLGDDYVLGEGWRDAVKGVMVLLNGELHGLDGGLTDRQLRHMLTTEGFDNDE